MKPLRMSSLAVLLAVLVSACGDAARPPAAVVQGSTITDDELTANIPLFRFLTSLRQAPCGEARKDESTQSACARFTLGQLISQEVVNTYAAAHDVHVQPRAVTNAIIPLEQQLGGHAALQQRLARQHLTFADLRGLAQRLLLVQLVAQDVASRTVSERRLRQAYAQNRVQFTELHAAHILVHNQRAAEKIAAQVTPQNFAELARRYSKDPGSAEQGGDLGETPASQLDPTFVQAALSLQPGEISAPVRTQFGWHLIMLISTRVLPYQQARSQLVDQLAAGSFTTWLQKQIESGGIEVNPRYGRFDPKQDQVLPIRCTAATPSSASCA